MDPGSTNPDVEKVLAQMDRAYGGMAHVAMHPTDHRVGDFAIVVIFLLTLVAARWVEKTLWTPRLRPTWLGGALIGLGLSASCAAFAAWGAWHSMRFGYIRCFAMQGRRSWWRRRHHAACGEDFWDVRMVHHSTYENFISLYNQPVAFWMFYLALTLFLVFMLSWLIVCVKAMRRDNRDVALAAERAHYARRKDRLA